MNGIRWGQRRRWMYGVLCCSGAGQSWRPSFPVDPVQSRVPGFLRSSTISAHHLSGLRYAGWRWRICLFYRNTETDVLDFVLPCLIRNHRLGQDWHDERHAGVQSRQTPKSWQRLDETSTTHLKGSRFCVSHNQNPPVSDGVAALQLRTT